MSNSGSHDNFVRLICKTKEAKSRAELDKIDELASQLYNMGLLTERHASRLFVKTMERAVELEGGNS